MSWVHFTRCERKHSIYRRGPDEYWSFVVVFHGPQMDGPTYGLCWRITRAIYYSQEHGEWHPTWHTSVANGEERIIGWVALDRALDQIETDPADFMLGVLL